MRQITAVLAITYGLTLGPATVRAAIPEHDPRTLIVKFAPSVDGKALAAELENKSGVLPLHFPSLDSLGAQSIRPLFPIPPSGIKNLKLYDSLGMGQVFLLTLRDLCTADQTAPVVAGMPDIETVELNLINRCQEAAVIPNDPLYPLQWHYARIHLPEAWATTKGSASVIVGVLDSGIDFGHPDIDLASRVAINSMEFLGVTGYDDDFNGYVDDVAGYDFVNFDGIPQDDNNHGTHVSGTIAAASNNGVGVCGVDWHCLVFSCKVANASGVSTVSAIVAALYYATNMGCDAINLSLGGPGNATYGQALNYAYANGVPIFAAMGNENTSTPSFAAAWPTTMSVGATDTSDARWVWSAIAGSNYGSHIGVVAPGDKIASTMPRSYSAVFPYEYQTGTSMATPHVTGLAALMLSVRPTLSVDSLYIYIALGAEDRVGNPLEDTPGWDPYYGFGRINAYNSIRLALGQCVCKCPNDPYCDGFTDVLDVVAAVNVAFRGEPAITDYGCPRQRTDVEGDGFSDVIDIVRLVNVAFRNASRDANFTEPCP